MSHFLSGRKPLLFCGTFHRFWSLSCVFLKGFRELCIGFHLHLTMSKTSNLKAQSGIEVSKSLTSCLYLTAVFGLQISGISFCYCYLLCILDIKKKKKKKNQCLINHSPYLHISNWTESPGKKSSRVAKINKNKKSSSLVLRHHVKTGNFNVKQKVCGSKEFLQSI